MSKKVSTTSAETLRALRAMFIRVLAERSRYPVVEGSFQSPYGLIKYHVYDDWVYFNLNDFDGEFMRPWLGWDHWKQNFHTFATQRKVTLEAMELEFRAHVARFFEDQGEGFLTKKVE